MTIHKLLLIALACTCLYACGGGSNDDDNDPANTDNPPVNQDDDQEIEDPEDEAPEDETPEEDMPEEDETSEEEDTQDNNGTASILNGTWLKACGPSESEFFDEEDREYDITTITFDNNRFTTRAQTFTDSECLLPTNVELTLDLPSGPTTMDFNDVTLEGDFSLGNKITTIGGFEALEIDTVSTSINGIAYQDFVDALNALTPGGFIDDSIVYSVFRIDGNELTTGIDTEERNGASPEQREIMLDLDRVFIKQ